MPSASKQLEEFTEATNNWNLEKLYIDLASAKGKALTPAEKKILRGLLCGYSPAEIADAVYKSRSSSVVRVYLSNALYKYIETLLNCQTDETIKITHWSRVTNLLEKAGYKTGLSSPFPSNNILGKQSPEAEKCLVSSTNKRIDWGEAVDVSLFCGRNKELTQLAQWIVADRCRLVLLLGMGGIGKTFVSVKLTQQIQDKFEYVIWRSLSHAPPIQYLLADLIQFFSGNKTTETDLLETVSSQISRLIEFLRINRCLLVLDGVESVLQEGTSTGFYRAGYEGYGELFRRVGEVIHQSCLVLTCREKPKEIALLQGVTLPVRCLQLRALKRIECQEILQAKGLFGADNEWRQLIQAYAGNPLFLKIAATTIKEVFGGDIAEFLQHDFLIYGEIRDLLVQHWNRLSDVEKKVMCWLAVHRKLVLVKEQPEEIIPSISRTELIEALEYLSRRALIESHATIFRPKPIFSKYITEQILKYIRREKDTGVIGESQFSQTPILGKLNPSPDVEDIQNADDRLEAGERASKRNQPLPDWYDGVW